MRPYTDKNNKGVLLKRKKLYALILMSTISILLYTIALFFHEKQNTFHDLVMDYFVETVGKDSLSLHYSFLDPTTVSLPLASTPLPLYEKETYITSKQYFEEKLRDLSNIEPASLSSIDQKNYTKLFESLSLLHEMSDYLYFDNPLSPYSGMQTQLPILLSEYQLNSQEDIDTYFDIITFLPTYFDSLISYKKDYLSYGMIFTATEKELLVDQCSSIVTESSILDSSHFMIETFQNRIEKLLENHVITLEEKLFYEKENQSLLLSYFYPAYTKLTIDILELPTSNTPLLGLYQYEHGRDYYTLLFRQSTGSSLAIEELKTLLASSFEKNYYDYTNTISQIDALQSANQQEITISLPFENAAEILINLQECMNSHFPIGTNDMVELSTTVSTVSTSLEDYVAPAYYLTPPIDCFTSNVIYINEKTPIDDLSLFTTLAHEGYPGHLYQTTYYYSQLNDPTSQLLTPLLSYMGYVEGWAYYVENESYEYAKSALPDSEYSQLSKLYIDAIQQNRNLQICLYSLLDVAIHYDGLTYEDVHLILTQFGISDAIQTYDIFEYISLNPTNYLMYYIGYEEVLSCKELAQTTWGTAYRDYDFHTLYLTHGPDTFSAIKKEIAP